PEPRTFGRFRVGPLLVVSGTKQLNSGPTTEGDSTVTVRVGINGFGRIGRNFFRAVNASGVDIDIVGVNDIAPVDVLAHFLHYDSILGRYPGEIETSDDSLIVDGAKIRSMAVLKPAELPWGELGADIVIESTGRFNKAADARGHVDGGAKKVILSAPGTDEDITVVLGVNDAEYDAARHTIISNASCTTNCLAPMAKVLLDNFGIERGVM